ncbi:UNVERIFIED_CONTAM: hypothetical protein GTU68_024547, partial [Idotea baltica]|nr:hypothetical protein [Idotea baltica]
MFSKKDFAATSFDSSWKKEQDVSNATSQTEPLETIDQECQVLENREVSVQTDKEEPRSYEKAKYDESSLVEFLQRILPHVEKEISKTSRSRAFDGYSNLNETLDTGEKCIHTLRWQHILPEHIVIDIGWSSTGSVIGVGYGVRLHDDWCSHKGAVAIWNINRAEFAANNPDQIIEISTCVTCLAFHPTNPSMLAVGNMAGEVMIFDLSRTEVATPYLRGDSD